MARIKSDGKVEFEFWFAVVIGQDGKTGNNKLFSFVTLGGPRRSINVTPYTGLYHLRRLTRDVNSYFCYTCKISISAFISKYNNVYHNSKNATQFCYIVVTKFCSHPIDIYEILNIFSISLNFPA